MKRRMMAVLLTLCMVLSMMPTVAFAAGSDFTDTDGHWAESIIEKWADYGVVSGLGNNKFGPNNELSRAQLAQVMYNLLKLTASEKDPAFEDVIDSAWYSAAVGACAREGIVSGIGNNKYGPSQVATREQCMVMLCNVFGINPLEDTSVLNQFKDKDSISNWAKGYVAALVKAGLVSGTKTGIAADTPINRASVLALLNNVVGVYITEPGEYDLKEEAVKGIVLVVCDDVKIINAAVGTTVTTGPNADNVIVNGDAVSADKTIVVEEETTSGGGGGSSRPSTPDEPEHECVFSDWTSNDDGTHSRTCECEAVETEDCTYAWDQCSVCGYADGIFHISTVEEMTRFAAIVNSGDDFQGETVVLEEDIDLTGVTWIPIGDASNKFDGTFDGQGHAISNLTVEGEEYVGLFGCAWTASSIENVALETVSVSGNHFVGAIAGKTYGDVTGCSVSEFEIAVTTNAVEGGYDNGDKVGGITGYAACGVISECSVSNGTIAAYRDVAGIVGANIKDNTYTEVTNCTVSNVIITVDQTVNGYGYKAPNAAAIIGRMADEADFEGNVEENVTITVKAEIEEDGETKTVVAEINGSPYTDLRKATDAATAGQTVNMLTDTTVEGGTGGYGVSGLVLAPGATLNGNGKTLTVEGANETWDCAIYTNGGTIKNLTITGAFRGIFTAGLTEELYVDNCVIDDVCYTFNADGGLDKPVEFTNCTINGWTSYSGTSKVTFDNCYLGKGTGGYQYANLVPHKETETYILNSEFCEGYELYAGYTDKIYLYECAVGGVKVTQENLVELLGEDAADAHVLTVEDDVIYSDGGTVLYGLTAEFNEDVLEVPAAVKEIGNQALKNSSISEIVLNEGLETIGYQAFSKTANLTSIEIPSTVTTIGEQAFRLSGIEELTIPENVTTIEAGAFRDMANLTTVTVEGNVVIPNYAWRSCPSLETVFLLGDNITFGGTSMVATHSDNGNATGITFYVKNQTVADALKTAQGSAYGYEVIFLNEISAGFYEMKNDEGTWYEISSKEGLEYFAKTVNGDSEADLVAENYSGMTVKLMADIDLNNEEWMPIGNSTNNFKGIFDGNEHKISNLNIDMADKSNVGLFGMTTNGEIKNLTIENATITGRLNVGVVAGTPYTSKYTNIAVTGHVEVNGMSYVGGVGGKNAYANWTDITVNVDETSYVNADSVENGTAYRTYVGGVIGFMGEGGHEVKNVTSNIDVIGSTCDVGGIAGIAHYGNKFTNCSSSGDVKITNPGDPEAAFEIGGIAGVWNNGGADVVFTDCSYTGTLTSPDVTSYPYGGLVGKAYSTSGSGKLIIDGAEMIIDGFGINEEESTYLVSNAAGMTMLKEYFGTAGSGDQTLVIQSDINMTDVEWTPITVQGYQGADIMTVEGNGAKITGLTAPLFAGGFAGGSGIVINDLIIMDSDIVSTNTQGSGAFIECVDSMDVITLKGCHLINSTVTGSRTGGLVGWTSGYNVQNDGPVDTIVTIEGCSVEGCTIIGEGSVGGIIGHAGANPATYQTITKCGVVDTKLVAIDDGDKRVGSIVGTANVGELEISECDAVNVTMTQVAAEGGTDMYSDYGMYGRFVPGTTGKLIIDGIEIVNE